MLWDVRDPRPGTARLLIPAPPITARAVGVSPIPGGRAHLGWATLSYHDGFTAHISASWVSPVKTRRTLLGGTERMLVYDDLAPVNRVTLFAGGTAKATPTLDTTEPLREVIRHFVSCIARAERPISDGAMGLRVCACSRPAIARCARAGVRCSSIRRALQRDPLRRPGGATRRYPGRAGARHRGGHVRVRICPRAPGSGIRIRLCGILRRRPRHRRQLRTSALHLALLAPGGAGDEGTPASPS